MSPKNGSEHANGQRAAKTEVRHLFALVAEGGTARFFDIGIDREVGDQAHRAASAYQSRNFSQDVVGVYSLPFHSDPKKMHEIVLGSKGVRHDLVLRHLVLEPLPSSSGTTQQATDAPAVHAPAPN